MTSEPSGQGHILCVASNFPRWEGDTTTPFVLHLAQDLQALGWRVTVLAPHAPGTASRENLAGVDTIRFRYLWPERLETVCYQGGALINLRKRPLNHAKLPILVAMESLAIARELLRTRYTILHTHFLLPQGFTGVLANVVARIPHVTTIHGSDIFALKSSPLLACKRFTLRHVDGVTVNSSVTEQALRDLMPDVPRVRRIPMGAAIPPTDAAGKAQELRQRYWSGPGPLLLFVGRLVEEKGVGDLLRAVAMVAPRLPGLACLIVGEGQDRRTFELLAAQLGIAEIVHFTGWVESRELPAWYRAADIFIGPSKPSREGWIEAQGLTFVEAMMAARPVIATRLGGVVDAVRHEETGLLVPEGSPAAIAEAILRLHADQALARQLGQAGQALAFDSFSRAASAAAFSTLFNELLLPSKL